MKSTLLIVAGPSSNTPIVPAERLRPENIRNLIISVDLPQSQHSEDPGFESEFGFLGSNAAVFEIDDLHVPVIRFP